MNKTLSGSTVTPLLKPQASSRRMLLDDAAFVGPTIAEMQAAWTETTRGEVHCRSIVDDIVRASFPHVASTYLDGLAVPFATQAVLSDLVEALSFAFLEREPHVLTNAASRPLDGLMAAAAHPTQGRRSSAAMSDAESEHCMTLGPHQLPDFDPDTRSTKPRHRATPPFGGGALVAPKVVVDAGSESEVTDEDDAARDDGSAEVFVPRRVRRQSVAIRMELSEAGWEPAPVSEPTTVPPDSWCRATIQQRKRIGETAKTPDVDVPLMMEDPSRLGANAATFRRSQGAVPRKPSSSSLGAESGGGKSGPLSTSASVAKANKNAGSGAGGSERPSRASSAGKRTAAGDEREGTRGSSPTSDSGGVDEARLLASVAETASRMKNLKALSESVHKQLQQMKPNATFVVDAASNKVVEVLQLDTKVLPPHRAEPKIAFQGQPDDDAPVDGGAAGDGASRPASRAFTPAAGGKPGGRAKKKEDSIQNFWQPEPNSNPMISDVQPAAGVTHREGDVVRHSDLKPQKSRLTKGEYTKLISLQAVSTTQVPSALDDVAPVPQQQGVAGVAAMPDKSKQQAAAAGSNAAGASSAGQTVTTSDNVTQSNGGGSGGAAATALPKRVNPLKASSAPNTRVATPVLIRRPGSEASIRSAEAEGILRRPGGGIAPVAIRTPTSRVSTPAPSATRPVVNPRVEHGAAAAAVKGVGGSRVSTPAAGATRGHQGTTATLRLRNFDETDDEVTRDFLLSYSQSAAAPADV